MRTRNHIVDLSTRSSRNDLSAEYRPLPVLIKKIENISVEALETSLIEMLNTADDRLFDMAETSYNNAQFDAMRLLRVKREGLISRFKQELSNNFKQTLGKITGSNGRDENIETLSFENIALVQDDDLEEDIATDAMVNKARAHNQDALEHIRIRLDTLVADKSVEQQNNPLEPVYICEAFRNATQALDLDIASLLVIYKLFDRSVIGQLESVYQQVNQFFVDKGILPELKIGTYVVKNQSIGSNQDSNDNINALPINETALNSNNVQASQNYNAGKTVIDEANVVSVIQQLLANSRGEQARSSQTTGDNLGSQIPCLDDVGGAVASGSVVVDTHQLVDVLSNIQVQQGQGAPSRMASLADLRQSIALQLPDQNKGSLGQFNEDMIDIVSMLFDFILEDENLESEIKSVIARLQIPMLKVGLVDKTFFSQRKHPARKLLNELAHAGLAWDKNDPTAKPMLVKISAIAEKVIQEFEEDISLFSELLEEFIQFKTQHQQRANIFEKRTKEAEEGKAKTENARGDVNRKLKAICNGQHIPEIVKKILKTVWSHTMLLERLKDNKEGWQRRVKVAKLLVWSVQPVESAELLEKMTSKIPLLVKSLRKGVELISLSPIEATHIFEQLEDCHRNVIETAKDRINSESENDSDILRLPAIDVDTVDIDLAQNFPEGFPQAIDESVPPIPEAEEIIIEDVGFTKAETGILPTKIMGEPVEITPETTQTIEQLRAGSWVELRIDNIFQRSKLAARIATSGKYIFVNRSGMKMAEFLTDELCQYLQLGNIKILDDDALFDRALESVISNLRAMKAEA